MKSIIPITETLFDFKNSQNKSYEEFINYYGPMIFRKYQSFLRRTYNSHNGSPYIKISYGYSDHVVGDLVDCVNKTECKITTIEKMIVDTSIKRRIKIHRKQKMKQISEKKWIPKGFSVITSKEIVSEVEGPAKQVKAFDVYQEHTKEIIETAGLVKTCGITFSESLSCDQSTGMDVCFVESGVNTDSSNREKTLFEYSNMEFDFENMSNLYSNNGENPLGECEVESKVMKLTVDEEINYRRILHRNKLINVKDEKVYAMALSIHKENPDRKVQDIIEKIYLEEEYKKMKSGQVDEDLDDNDNDDFD